MLKNIWGRRWFNCLQATKPHDANTTTRNNYRKHSTHGRNRTRHTDTNARKAGRKQTSTCTATPSNTIAANCRDQIAPTSTTLVATNVENHLRSLCRRRFAANCCNKIPTQRLIAKIRRTIEMSHSYKAVCCVLVGIDEVVVVKKGRREAGFSEATRKCPLAQHPK